MLKTIRAVKDALLGAMITCAANPLRTALSILAIGTAVSTIAIVVSGLQGFQRFAELTSARAFGSDTFLVAQVVASRLNRKELARKLERNPPIRRSDVRFLEKHAGGKVTYSPVAQIRATVTSRGRKFEGASLNGAEAAMFQIRDLGISRGRFFREEEARKGSQVAVVGAEIVEQLFPGEDALGKRIRVGGRGFTIIGLQEKQGTAGGVSLDIYVWIPLLAFERVFGAPTTLQVFARGPDPKMTETAESRASVTFRARRRLRPGKEDNFDILSPEAARSFVVTLSERISAAAVPISLAALLAAIVVVTNTSLVSVTQRTRDIGIRRAVGASRSRIILEVLAESGLVSVAGGLLGLLLARGLLFGGQMVLNLELSLTPSTVGWSLLAASFSGILAGVYPARRAAQIEVINALRSE